MLHPVLGPILRPLSDALSVGGSIRPRIYQYLVDESGNFLADENGNLLTE